MDLFHTLSVCSYCDYLYGTQCVLLWVRLSHWKISHKMWSWRSIEEVAFVIWSVWLCACRVERSRDWDVILGGEEPCRNSCRLSPRGKAGSQCSGYNKALKNYSSEIYTNTSLNASWPYIKIEKAKLQRRKQTQIQTKTQAQTRTQVQTQRQKHMSYETMFNFTVTASCKEDFHKIKIWFPHIT